MCPFFSKIKKKRKSWGRNNSLCEVDKLQTKGKTKPASQRYKKKNVNFYLCCQGDCVNRLKQREVAGWQQL